MPSHKGRDLLLKINSAGSPTVFTTIGAARTTAMTINNNPQDATTMDSDGLQQLDIQAGVQSMQIRLDGLFKDAAAEETLRDAAFARAARRYQMVFPNGDMYEADFIVESYSRGGTHDGLETFGVVLSRTGGGTFTAGGA